MQEERLKVLVDGEWHEASPEFQETVRRIDEGLKRKFVSMRCPAGCAWGQFPDEEPVGMTPCHSCNSTGYVFEPLVGEIDGH